MRRILIDSGILLSYYQQQEPLHQAVVDFFDHTAAQLITSPICIAEVLWLLGDPGDYARIAELNVRYADRSADFADLTLATLSERLDVAEILTLDGDFDIYRRFRREPFRRVPIG
ncbi:MAG: VapC toxin family PIN domain ribonuclease [Synechococcaceae cyanobacterium]|nr:VapC toxin family PIN domain ribonuclease [Synechococcaceae cyanobacterium]